MNIK
jgi:hypothetical protein